MRHGERHRTARIGWLRAAVLGANDGIVSTASLVLGVAAAQRDARGRPGRGRRRAGRRRDVDGGRRIRLRPLAGRHRERRSRARAQELSADDQGERRELAAIYVARGLDAALATQVADQLMAHDALGAHARDELGITPRAAARPSRRRSPRPAASPSAPPCPSRSQLSRRRRRCSRPSPRPPWSSSRSWAPWPPARAARTWAWAHGASLSGARSRWR